MRGQPQASVTLVPSLEFNFVSVTISGFPEFILDPEQLDKKYSDLEIKENEYFMNNIRVNQYNLKKNIQRLDQVVNKTRYATLFPLNPTKLTDIKTQPQDIFHLSDGT